MSRFVPILLLLVLLHLAGAHNRVDMIRPDAPALAAFGEFTPGVRTLEFTNPDQLDIAAWRPGQELHRYDRPLVAEVWYPASVPPDSEHEHAYTVVTRDGTTTAILLGRAHRDAPPSLSRAPFPLVILSHGYPGNRFALGHLGENLASKGYVVVSIDHTDSTYVDQRALGSSLLNRPLDQLFVLNEMARMTEDEASILEGVVDANRTAIIGFSMGATGALNAVGAGFTEASVGSIGIAPPANALRVRQAGQPEYLDSFDERVRAVVAIGPWGIRTDFFDADGLRSIETPVLFIAGSHDTYSGYQDGVKLMYELALGAPRYLLTFENASHNAAAPIAAPREVTTLREYSHYADPVWDTTRMNNIAQHFITAFLGVHLRGDRSFESHLDLIEVAEDGVVARDRDGEPTEEHTAWHGFPDRTTVGLRFERADPE